MDEKYYLIILLISIFALNYSFLDSFITNVFEEQIEQGIVNRVIDGDTVKINNESIRLLGINAPEKGEKYSQEAKEFLESLILNKEVYLKFENQKYDRYNRKLAYIFIDNENVNLELVKEGFANIYFPMGKNKYYQEFEKGWELCLERNKNLCEKSKEDCIKLVNWNIDNQLVILQNICSNGVNLNNWTIKDEGRKKLTLNKILNSNEKLILTNEDWSKNYVWTKSGDSIFIRDNLGKLVFWDSY